jgi:hypothetical protein
VSTPESCDRQQAVVLDMLRRAGGAPVTFIRLQEAGVEFPASIVAELELGGVAVARCRIHAEGARAVAAVRLDPELDKAQLLATDDEDDHRLGRTLAPLAALPPARARRLRWRRPVALGVLVVVLAALATGALLSLDKSPGVSFHPRPTHLAGVPASTAGGRKHRRTPAAHKLPPSSRRPDRTAQKPRVKPAPTHHSPPQPVSVTDAWSLDARGHALLLDRDYGAAITTLRSALAATGEQLADCHRPASETCLIYGYALYDIGQALLLTGHPAAAVSVFERRLAIDNQIPVVEAALTLARTQAA